MTVMGTTTTVNFEDLFDFSPEPLDPLDRDEDYIEDQLVNPSIHQTEQRIYTTLRPAQSQSPRTFLPDRLSLSPKTSKLSASLPTGWASNLSGSYTGSSSPGSREFWGRAVGSEESFGHLVEDLTSAVDATRTTATPSSGGSERGKGKRGRKPGQKSSKPDMKNKLERSRQSARECRARKKLRYQYLDDMIIERERANLVLRDELLRYQAWCHELDKGKIPDGLKEFLKQIKNQETAEQQSYQM